MTNAEVSRTIAIQLKYNEHNSQNKTQLGRQYIKTQLSLKNYIWGKKFRVPRMGGTMGTLHNIKMDMGSYKSVRMIQHKTDGHGRSSSMMPVNAQFHEERKLS